MGRNLIEFTRMQSATEQRALAEAAIMLLREERTRWENVKLMAENHVKWCDDSIREAESLRLGAEEKLLNVDASRKLLGGGKRGQ